MTKLWGGPWIGRTTVLPTSGVFALYPTSITSNNWGVVSGTALGAVSKGGTGVLTAIDTGTERHMRCVFDPETALWIGEQRVPLSALPLGFTILNAMVDVPLEVTGGSTFGRWVEYSAEHRGATGNHDYEYPGGTPPSLATLLAEGCGVGYAVGYPPPTTITNAAGSTLLVYGDYEIQ